MVICGSPALFAPASIRGPPVRGNRSELAPDPTGRERARKKDRKTLCNIDAYRQLSLLLRPREEGGCRAFGSVSKPPQMSGEPSGIAERTAMGDSNMAAAMQEMTALVKAAQKSRSLTRAGVNIYLADPDSSTDFGDGAPPPGALAVGLCVTTVSFAKGPGSSAGLSSWSRSAEWPRSRGDAVGSRRARLIQGGR